MRLGVALPFHAAAIADAARSAERHGFDSVWVLDAHNRGFMLPDPFVALAIAASVTERVELGSSIIQVPSRRVQTRWSRKPSAISRKRSTTIASSG